MTSYTDEQIEQAAIRMVASVEKVRHLEIEGEWFGDLVASMLRSILADRTRLQAELKSEQSRCGDLEQQCEAEAAVASSYFDQVAELQAEVEAFFASMEVRAYEFVLLSDKKYNQGDLVRADGYAKAARALREEIDSARAKKGTHDRCLS